MRKAHLFVAVSALLALAILVVSCAAPATSTPTVEPTLMVSPTPFGGAEETPAVTPTPLEMETETPAEGGTPAGTPVGETVAAPSPTP